MWSQVLDRKSRRGMSALDSAKVIRYGNTLPKWTADTSKISPQNPIIHRANPILQLALGPEIMGTKRATANRAYLHGRRRELIALSSLSSASALRFSALADSSHASSLPEPLTNRPLD